MNSLLSRVGVSTRRMSSAASAIAASGFPADGVASAAEAGETFWQLVRDREQIVHVLQACVLDLELRHASLVHGNRWRIGASIAAASAPDRQRLHRIIVRHQRIFAG